MPVRYKGIMIILDGLGDNPSPELHGKTPLGAADTPNMDRLAAEGMCGLTDPLGPGIPVGTHTGSAALMGAPPGDVAMLRRGPVEAAGIGLKPREGDILLRCNFATLRPNGTGFDIIDRRAGRIQEGTETLAAELQNIPLPHGITGTLKPTTQHRAVLHLSGDHLSQQITDTDAGDRFRKQGVHESVPLDPSDRAAQHTADAVNAFIRIAHEHLQAHPINARRRAAGLPVANGIVTRGAGEHRELRSLANHYRIPTAVVAAERTVLGLARLFNYTFHENEGFTALPDTPLEAKVQAVLQSLEQHALVFLHIKGTDICSHDRHPLDKQLMIERIDRAIAPLIGPDRVIAITGDHTTDSTLGEHTGDPVPTLLHTPAGRRDQTTRFDETTCMTGGLGRITGTALLASLLDAMGAITHYRPSDAPYY